MRMIDADELIRNLEGIISDYTSNGFYPDRFGIDDFIDVVKEMPTIPAPKWISVEDRLPEDAGDVLVVAFWHEKYQVLTGWHSLGGWLVTAGNEERLLDVTHWMPLPEPPEKRYKCRYADDNGACDKFTESEEIVYCTGRPCLYYTPVEV